MQAIFHIPMAANFLRKLFRVCFEAREIDATFFAPMLS